MICWLILVLLRVHGIFFGHSSSRKDRVAHGWCDSWHTPALAATICNQAAQEKDAYATCYSIDNSPVTGNPSVN